MDHCSTYSGTDVAISVQPFRYDLDTLRSESTTSLQTLHDTQTPVLSTGQNSVVVRCLSLRASFALTYSCNNLDVSSRTPS